MEKLTKIHSESRPKYASVKDYKAAIVAELEAIAGSFGLSIEDCFSKAESSFLYDEKLNRFLTLHGELESL